jgi:hypothetical protein
MRDDIVGKLLLWALFGGCGLVVALIGLAIYDVIVVETFTLRKNEWTCTEKHVLIVGKTPIVKCDNWRRI